MPPLNNAKKMNKCKQIAEISRRYYNLSPEMFYGKTNKREAVQARQIAHLLAKQNTNLSLAKIGAEIGSKDNVTVLHSIKTISNLIDTDKVIRSDFYDIEAKVKNIIDYTIDEDEVRAAILAAIMNRFNYRINQINKINSIL